MRSPAHRRRRRRNLSPSAGFRDRDGRQVRQCAVGGPLRRLLRPCRTNDDTGFYGAAEPGGGTRSAANCDRSTSSSRTSCISFPDRSGPSRASTRPPSIFWRRGSINGERRGPKIVASTATVRRAERQIRSLFGRDRTAIFPPPGVDRDNSFFAEADRETPSRLYVGRRLAGPGPEARLPARFADACCRSRSAVLGRRERSRRSLFNGALLLQRTARTGRRPTDRRRRSSRASHQLRAAAGSAASLPARLSPIARYAKSRS